MSYYDIPHINKEGNVIYSYLLLLDLCHEIKNF